MIQVKSFVFSPFQVNSYIIYDETKHAVIIDAACYDKEEWLQLKTFIAENKIKAVRHIITHGHIDHLFGCNFIAEEYALYPEMHIADDFLLRGAVDFARMYGMECRQPVPPKSYIDINVPVCFGNNRLEFIHLPGHSPGSVVVYCSDGNVMFTGDVLFAGSIGRTDLPGGNYHQLIKGIKSLLLSFPSDTIIYPGHGTVSTIGNEKTTNPFLQN